MASSRFSSFRKSSYREAEPQPKDEIESDDEDAMLDIRFVRWSDPFRSGNGIIALSSKLLKGAAVLVFHHNRFEIYRVADQLPHCLRTAQ